MAFCGFSLETKANLEGLDRFSASASKFQMIHAGNRRREKALQPILKHNTQPPFVLWTHGRIFSYAIIQESADFVYLLAEIVFDLFRVTVFLFLTAVFVVSKRKKKGIASRISIIFQGILFFHFLLKFLPAFSDGNLWRGHHAVGCVKRLFLISKPEITSLQIEKVLS